MIIQSISCDMCGAQKRETNHWFLANQESGELHVSQWTSEHLLCPGTKHLCGESCLHKFLGEFLAHALQAPTPQKVASVSPQQAADPAGTSVDVEPRATLRLQRQLTSTLTRSGQYVNRALVDDRRRCRGRRTS